MNTSAKSMTCLAVFVEIELVFVYLYLVLRSTLCRITALFAN